MRPVRTVEKSRRGNLAAGASKIAAPASAVALTAGLAAPAIAVTSASQGGSSTPLQMRVSAHRIAYGRKVTVTGTAPASDAGQPVALEYDPAASSTWRTVASTTVGGGGHFRMGAALPQSGLLKVMNASGASTGAPAPRAAANPGAATVRRIIVAADLRLRRGGIGVVGGQAVDVHGRLLPGVAGRKVRLEARGNGGWHTLAWAHTGRRGNFRLRFVAGATGRQPLRVRFGGDQLNGWASAPAGQLTVYRQSLASWYDDGGSTACGFHAYYGVANKVLPCGTKVSFRYGGNTVTAVVDDRGPYAGGREWDLNQNTAAALGFSGVGTVWSSA